MSVLPIATGFGLRVIAKHGPLRMRCAEHGDGLSLQVQHAGAWRSCSIAEGAEPATSDVASVQAGPSRAQWWLETASYRVPLPRSWTLVASGMPDTLPPFELLGAGESKIFIRTPRRMPSLTSLLSPGQNFRDTGQLERAAWIEFEATRDGRAWTHRHELLHRGLMAFVFTLEAPDDQLALHVPTLAELVQQVERMEPQAG